MCVCVAVCVCVCVCDVVVVVVGGGGVGVLAARWKRRSLWSCEMNFTTKSQPSLQ